MTRLAADTVVGEPAVNIAIFLVFVAVTLVIVYRASANNKTASDYYAAGRAFSGPQNGAYKHSERFPFGDQIKLPEPFGGLLDTAVFPG